MCEDMPRDERADCKECEARKEYADAFANEGQCNHGVVSGGDCYVCDEIEAAEEDEGEEDDDDERPRGEALEVMTPTQFNAHRLEAWEMAYAALTRKDGNPRDWGDDYKVDPSDVLILARFIEGDDLGE